VSRTWVVFPIGRVPGFETVAGGWRRDLSILPEMNRRNWRAIGASRRYDGPLGKSDPRISFWIGRTPLGTSVPIDRRFLICFLR